MVIFLWRSFLVLAICLFSIRDLSGQSNHPTDSLNQVLLNTHDNRVKARVLLSVSQQEEIRDPGKALYYARKAKVVAMSSHFDSAEIRAMILIGANLIRLNHLKEAIEIGGQIIEMASRLGMPLEIADGREVMAVAYAQVGDFDNSSKLYFENLTFYEKLNNKRLLASTLGNIGADFISQESYDKALDYTTKAIAIAEETNNLTLLTDQYNNLAAIYQIHFKDYSKALQNYYKALKVAIQIDDFQQQGLNLLNISRVFRELDELDSLYQYVNKALALFQKVDNQIYIADCYVALGEYYFDLHDYNTGKTFAFKALEIGERYKMHQTIFGASDLLKRFYLAVNDSAKAFKYMAIRTQASDSLYALQSQKALFKAELQYNQEKSTKEQKLKQQKSYFIFGFVIFGLLSGLLMAVLLYSRQKIKVKNVKLEKAKAEADLNFKSKELSINILALLKKNELIADIRQKFTELEKALPDSEVRNTVSRFNLEIKQSSDDRLWQEFSIRFKEINSEFYNKLLQKFPDLTQSELKLCAYLRLNMSTKEISELTGQSTETLGKARYRLRKKFGLTNSESNLVMFLSQV